MKTKENWLSVGSLANLSTVCQQVVCDFSLSTDIIYNKGNLTSIKKYGSLLVLRFIYKSYGNLLKQFYLNMFKSKIILWVNYIYI